MPEYVIEMLWRCSVSTCGAVTRGTVRQCSGCGKPKEERDEEMFPEDISQEAAILDADKIRRARAGADFKCRYCGSLQSRADGECARCGGAKAEGLRSRQAGMTATESASGGDRKVRRECDDDSCPSNYAPPRKKAVVEVGQSPGISLEDVRAPEYSTDPFPAERPYVDVPNAGYRDSAKVAEEPVSTSLPDDGPLPSFNRPWLRSPSPAQAAVAAVLLLTGGLLWLLLHTRDVDAEVRSVSWKRTVHVERWAVHHHDGWSAPGDSFHVRDLGPRVHHYDHVLVGSHSESYTVQEACGQDCRTVAPTCYTTSRSCTSNKNGTATCSGGDRVCSGGGQSCSTRYCSVPRTRTVNDYQDQPRYRDYYDWDVWEWAHQRDAVSAGATTECSWPSEEQVHVGAGLSEGERERESGRDAVYAVRLGWKDETKEFEPKSEQEFLKFRPGTKHRARVGIVHGVEILGPGR